jgi:imidazolonepropionase
LVEARLSAQLRAGTTTVEAKSGYGLTTAEEERHLRIIGHVAQRLPMRVVRTFLGAHARPPDRPDYVDEVVERMLPAVAGEDLAEFCDVFCDAGFFAVDEAERILAAARAAGLGIRLHADQLQRIGATALAVRLGATSADHLEQLDEEGVALLAGSATVATLLPGPALVMRDRLPPARALLDAGATVALATDANAGTFGAWGAMPLVIGLGATVLGMTAAEAVRAATLGGAGALGLADERGHLAVGAAADLVAWDAEHEGAFALHLGSVRASQVVVGGRSLPAVG